MQSKLYGVGIGPGNPDYLTIRAVEVLKSVDVIFTVISKNSSDSISKNVVDSLSSKAEIKLQVFTMSRNKEERFNQVHKNAEEIIEALKEGKNCAFATLGDPMTYSTFGYVLEYIKEKIPQLDYEIVPGITSFSTLAARSKNILVENKNMFRVIPSFTADVAENLEFPNNSTTILLKTYKSRKALLERLKKEKDIKIVYGEHISMSKEKILTDIEAIENTKEEYLSLMMIKKGNNKTSDEAFNEK